MTAVNATVRLQFHREFTLDHAVPLVAYFKDLGISHIYASPILKARAGSMHGYDVVDPSCINPELGGEAALARLVAELRKHDMGLLVDIVCNHMAVGGDNPWWQDVLRWGLKSPYAHFFDIQWNSPDPLLKGQLLLPFLSGNYGDVLANGEITLHFDADAGEFYAQHYDHRFPIYPPSYCHILRNADDSSLQLLIPLFEKLEDKSKEDKPQNQYAISGNGEIALEENEDYSAQELHQLLSNLARNKSVANNIQKALALYKINKPDDALDSATATTTGSTTTGSADKNDEPNKNDNIQLKDSHAGDVHPDWQANENLQRLHELLELQHYRLASWRTAADDINWRRFFDVNELAGLRIERAEVFEASHSKIFELVARGWIDGLRIDHVDGLANPRAYCRKLRRRLNNLRAQRPAGYEHDHLPIYVEKILADSEQLNTDWKVDGTTGYEFMNQVSLLQHDPHGSLQLFDLWTRISGRDFTFEQEIEEARRLVLASSLAGDVEMVAQNLLLIARSDIATRDLPLGAIRRALIELVVNFSVYRTYAYACGRSAQDQTFFSKALTGAREKLAEIDWPVLEYLDRWLGGQPLHDLPPGATRTLRKKTLARFQQLTSPAAAKAVEDTACYRSAVLLSRNDVGFDPQHFSAPLTQFHQQNTLRAQNFPVNLLTTATHDHKRGEDMRARLAVISERSVWFTTKINHWQTMAAPLRVALEDGVAPSPGDEIMLYQTLLGSWPLSLSADDLQGLKTYLERLLRWQEKALREAKLRSSWSAPNTAYETANRDFLTRLLTDENFIDLRADIASAVQIIAPAGALNSLSQTLLRMTVPGVPDLYQGAEFWDFSLVDPDNRQPVNFTERLAALASNRTSSEVILRWQDGHIKQWLIAQTLRIRQRHASLFLQGDYQTIGVEGKFAVESHGEDHLVVFSRHYQNKHLLVVAPRFTANLLADSATPFIPATQWGDARLVLPPDLNLGGSDGKLNLSSHILVDSLAPIGNTDGANATENTTEKGTLFIRDILANCPVNFLIFEKMLPAI